MMALFAVESERARAFASNAGVLDGLLVAEFGFAETLSVDGVTSQGFLLLADALE